MISNSLILGTFCTVATLALPSLAYAGISTLSEPYIPNDVLAEGSMKMPNGDRIAIVDMFELENLDSFIEIDGKETSRTGYLLIDYSRVVDLRIKDDLFARSFNLAETGETFTLVDTDGNGSLETKVDGNSRFSLPRWAARKYGQSI